MDKYEFNLLAAASQLRYKDYLAEADHDTLVRQAKQSPMRKLSKTLKVKQAFGQGLMRLGNRIALGPKWQDA